MRNKIYFILSAAFLLISCGKNNKCNNTYCPQGTICENGFCQGLPSFTDQDGNVYHEIAIGTQTWMQENLKTAHYRNGDPIPTGLNDIQWANDTLGAYAVISDTAYGKLYNWYAVVDQRCLCPTGWHIPHDSEWTTLTNALGFPSGGQMKAAVGWPAPNVGATNTSGFYGLPGKKRFYNGFYSTNSSYGYWWSSTQDFANTAWARQLTNETDITGQFTTYKAEGLSVRCIKD